MSIDGRTAPFNIFSDSNVQGYAVGTGEINGRMRALRLLKAIDSNNVEEAYTLLPNLLSFLKHDDPVVVRQTITTGANLFSAVLAEMSLQICKSNNINGWLEEMWSGMLQFKDAVQGMLSIGFGYHDSIGPRILAVKFLENCFLLFTSNGSDNEEGRKHKFSISWLDRDHLMLNPAMLKFQARQILDSFFDILKSADTLNGTFVITTINCLAAIAKKRPVHYNTILSLLVDFDPNFEAINGSHAASIQCAVRVAILGFLRCTHSPIFESRERLLGALRSKYPGEATEQTIRQMEKISRNINLISRDAHLNASDKDEMHAGELSSMRTHLIASDSIYIYTQKNSVMENTEPTPAKKMLAVIGNLLAKGEKGYNCIERLVSELDAAFLADMVIETMNESPEITTLHGRNGNLLPSSYTDLPSVSSQNGFMASMNVASDFATAASAYDSISTSDLLLVHNTASSSKRDQKGVIHDTASNSSRDPRKVVQNTASNSNRDPRMVVHNTASNSKRDPRRDPRRQRPQCSFPKLSTLSWQRHLLSKQLKGLLKNPVDGFSAGLIEDTNKFEWSVSIIGPPDTYDGVFL